MTLQWRPPEAPNGIITQYTIKLNGTDFNNISGNMLMYTVGGLSPDTVYVLHLRAHTGAGAGYPISVTIVTCKLLNIASSCNIIILYCICDSSTTCLILIVCRLAGRQLQVKYL